jgi:hypothetical protein
VTNADALREAILTDSTKHLVTLLLSYLKNEVNNCGSFLAYRFNFCSKRFNWKPVRLFVEIFKKIR